MTKRIENKFNRFVENSDPQILEENFVEYTIEAMDDVINGDKDGLTKLDTVMKFFKDHKNINPDIYSRASKKINEHVFNILSKKFEDAQISNYILNLRGFLDIVTLDYINELINIYLEKKDDKYLQNAVDQINIFRKDKIRMLDNEILPEALTELQKISLDYQDYDEKMHEELKNDIKKITNDIQNNDYKSE